MWVLSFAFWVRMNVLPLRLQNLVISVQKIYQTQHKASEKLSAWGAIIFLKKLLFVFALAAVYERTSKNNRSRETVHNEYSCSSRSTTSTANHKNMIPDHQCFMSRCAAWAASEVPWIQREGCRTTTTCRGALVGHDTSLRIEFFKGSSPRALTGLFVCWDKIGGLKE